MNADHFSTFGDGRPPARKLSGPLGDGRDRRAQPAGPRNSRYAVTILRRHRFAYRSFGSFLGRKQFTKPANAFDHSKTGLFWLGRGAPLGAGAAAKGAGRSHT